MSDAPGEQTLRFLFDQHVSGPALRQLRTRGVDVLHVAEVGLAEADDPEILRWAQRERRIVVTRNYRDFAPLVRALAAAREPFPGVLFLPSSLRSNDVGRHVTALTRWITEAETAGENPIANSLGWLA
jgi:predicted nuclease of predicted toxin-antitoxin system